VLKDQAAYCIQNPVNWAKEFIIMKKELLLKMLQSIFFHYLTSIFPGLP